MQLRLFATAIITCGIALGSLPAAAQSLDLRSTRPGLSRTCLQAITRVEDNLINRAALTASRERPRSHPRVGQYRDIIFTVSGRVGNNVLNSPQLMMSLASDVYQNCSNERVVTVTFGYANSGWFLTIGPVNGSLQFFSCLEDLGRQPRPLGGNFITPWGYDLCV